MTISRYHRLFFATYGMGPYPCTFCGELIQFDDFDKATRNPKKTQTRPYVLVHHLDGDHHNDIASNLGAAHRSCHNGHHSRENKMWRNGHTAEAIAKRSAALRGRPLSEETKAKISAALTGRTLSDKHRAALSRARRRNRD